MESQLANDLHASVALIDRAADALLHLETGLTYRRWLALRSLYDLGQPTQRELADALSVSEPAVSRMTARLAEEGYLDVAREPGGRRHRLSLTPMGEQAVRAGRHAIENQLEHTLAGAGIDFAAYAAQTRQVVVAFETATERLLQQVDQAG